MNYFCMLFFVFVYVILCVFLHILGVGVGPYDGPAKSVPVEIGVEVLPEVPILPCADVDLEKGLGGGLVVAHVHVVDLLGVVAVYDLHGVLQPE